MKGIPRPRWPFSKAPDPRALASPADVTRGLLVNRCGGRLPPTFRSRAREVWGSPVRRHRPSHNGLRGAQALLAGRGHPTTRACQSAVVGSLMGRSSRCTFLICPRRIRYCRHTTRPPTSDNRGCRAKPGTSHLPAVPQRVRSLRRQGKPLERSGSPTGSRSTADRRDRHARREGPDLDRGREVGEYEGMRGPARSNPEAGTQPAPRPGRSADGAVIQRSWPASPARHQSATGRLCNHAKKIIGKPCAATARTD